MICWVWVLDGILRCLDPLRTLLFFSPNCFPPLFKVGVGVFVPGHLVGMGSPCHYPGWHSLTKLNLSLLPPQHPEQAAAGHSSYCWICVVHKGSFCVVPVVARTLKLLSALPSLSSLGHMTLSSSMWACSSCVQNPANRQILCNKEPATQAGFIGLWAVMTAACLIYPLTSGQMNGLSPFLQTCSVLSKFMYFFRTYFLLLDSLPFCKSAHF